jgi:hypothetical protein
MLALRGKSVQRLVAAIIKKGEEECLDEGRSLISDSLSTRLSGKSNKLYSVICVFHFSSESSSQLFFLEMSQRRQLGYRSSIFDRTQKAPIALRDDCRSGVEIMALRSEKSTISTSRRGDGGFGPSHRDGSNRTLNQELGGIRR